MKSGSGGSSWARCGAGAAMALLVASLMMSGCTAKTTSTRPLTTSVGAQPSAGSTAGAAPPGAPSGGTQPPTGTPPAGVKPNGTPPAGTPPAKP